MAGEYPLGLEPPPPYADGNSPAWISWLTDALDTIRIASIRPGAYFLSYNDGDPASHIYAQAVWHALATINYTSGTGLLTIRGDYGFSAAGGGCASFSAECKITKDGIDQGVFTGTSAMVTATGDSAAHAWTIWGKVTGGGCAIAFYGFQLVIEER